MSNTEAGKEPVYVGFWMRVVAAIIDTIAIGIVVWLVIRVLGLEVNTDPSTGMPNIDADYWQNLGANQLLSAGAIVAFWIWKGATPGKMVIGAVIVDAQTLDKPSTGQLIGRYLGYFLSTLPLGLGLLWVGFDKRKQGWHDKLAGTVVIKSTPD